MSKLEISDDTLSACFDAVVKRQPHNTAIVHGDSEISYIQLLNLVHDVAKGLSALSTEPSGRIALIAKKSLETVAVILAAQRLQVILVVINPLLKSAQLAHILEDSGACTLLCDEHGVNSLIQCKTMPACLQHLVLMPPPVKSNNRCSWSVKNLVQFKQNFSNSGINLNTWDVFLNTSPINQFENVDHPNRDDAAIILYTSGSTGQPKGVTLSHANIFFGAASVSTYLGNTNKDRILAMLPMSFDYGLSQLTTSIYTGATLVLYDYFTPKGVVDTVVKHKITGIPAVPHIWDQMTKIVWPSLVNLRYITSTGGRLQPKTIRLLAEKLPDTAIYSMYGFTEAFRATYLPPAELRFRPDSIGKAVPYANVLVVDSEGKELPPGEQGELIQSGPLVSLGYWNDKYATAEKFRLRQFGNSSSDLFAWSGDLAYKDAEGYLYFVSRKDDQVKLNGYRSSPTEIETKLLDCPYIYEASVACIQDEKFGYVAIAFVVLNNTVNTGVLSHWSKQNLPSFMVPARWFIMDRLPVTPNNKIDRKALHAQIQGNS